MPEFIILVAVLFTLLCSVVIIAATISGSRRNVKTLEAANKRLMKVRKDRTNKLIEVTGTPRSIVYVGEEALLSFPTNQQAWEYLSELFKTAGQEPKQPWPEEVYVAFMLEEVGDTILIPQIDKAVILADQLKYKGLFGSDFEDFRQRIIDDWPNIKKGLKNA